MPPPARTLALSIIEVPFAIVRLASDAPIPGWATSGAIFSVTRTADELSVVAAEATVPAQQEASRGWRMLKVHGPFAFSEVGVLASLAGPLAGVGVGIFVISTFDTDYLLVQQEEIAIAVEALEHAGHRISNLKWLTS